MSSKLNTCRRHGDPCNFYMMCAVGLRLPRSRYGPHPNCFSYCCDSGLASAPGPFFTEWSRSDPDLGPKKWGLGQDHGGGAARANPSRQEGRQAGIAACSARTRRRWAIRSQTGAYSSDDVPEEWSLHRISSRPPHRVGHHQSVRGQPGISLPRTEDST
jgi:hypothetical protein